MQQNGNSGEPVSNDSGYNEKEIFQRYKKTKSAADRNVIVNKYLYLAEILAKKFIMGRLGMQFRTWMPEMAMRRWGAERDDKILGIKTKGRWRSYRAVWEATVDSENPDISYTK